jgi:hypothetical protein
MHHHAANALAHPVYDPERQLGALKAWSPERLVTAKLSVNIGME